jgi:hypothetical protein
VLLIVSPSSLSFFCQRTGRHLKYAAAAAAVGMFYSSLPPIIIFQPFKSWDHVHSTIKTWKGRPFNGCFSSMHELGN